MQLSVLESRLLHKLPEKHHETVEKEFEKFEMETSRLSKDADKTGQATLTDREISRATTTNQNGEHGHTIIELQCIKAVGMEYQLEDWLSYVDPTLTYEENIDIIKSESNSTMKESMAKQKEVQRWK
jgi:hypothetical protein